MSLFGKIMDRINGTTAMKKGYSDPESEIVEASLKGDVEDIFAITCEEPKKEVVEEEKKDSWQDPWDNKKEDGGW